MMKQPSFLSLTVPWQHRYCHGGTLRKTSKGRGSRPLSTKDPIHLVLKINKSTVRGGLRNRYAFKLMTALIKRYSLKFFIKIEQFSIQNDHVHLLIRGSRRSKLQSFLRVLPGQFAQNMTDTPETTNEGKKDRREKIWKYRPFTRIVKGFKPYQIVRNYIQLNECEANGRPYSKTRLRGLTQEQLIELWNN
ncbi:transposase [Bdellovibrio sp. KM01]|uniref:transposase n=1 Tax=Bdellovibrio sp. KM01 TaxID=2748865 RepID=UPI0015E929EC|nr:transposase [Bdellovibrio sp. KM01]QLY25968.1 transposase [Bdellovibrio sp. KM01]